MHASYKDSLNDIVTTGLIVFGLYFSSLFGFDIDGYLGVGVAIFIVISGVKLLKEAIDKLLGEAVDEEILSNVEAYICEEEAIFDIHDVLAHQYGEGKIFMSVHAEMDASLSLLVAHEIVDKLERNVKNRYGIELLIHIDPIDFSDNELVRIKAIIQTIVSEVDSMLAIHDVRIDNNKNKRVYFDLVMPFNYSNRSKIITDQIIEEITRRCKYKCSIDINFK